MGLKQQFTKYATVLLIMTAQNLIIELKKLANPQKAKVLQGFFKTGQSQYGAGDVFWGITVPAQRKIAKSFKDLTLTEVKKLIYSSVHEQRLTGLLILVYQYEQADQNEQNKIFEFYFKHRTQVNNWDLVDVTTPKIVGQHILNKPELQPQVFALINSTNLWDRRIALLATFPFIKKEIFQPTLSLATKVLADQHDLIHKASGWMLREVGKMQKKPLLDFLDKHKQKMPRTMLRYAIEKLAEPVRKKYLAK
ncbi:MAG: DNA alkylation repair protein [Patescibacteria group bacterium]